MELRLVQQKPLGEDHLKSVAAGEFTVTTYELSPHAAIRNVWIESNLTIGDASRASKLSLSELTKVVKGELKFETDEMFEEACRLIRLAAAAPPPPNPNGHLHVVK